MDPTNQAVNGSSSMSKHVRTVEPAAVTVSKKPIIPFTRRCGLRKKTLSLNPEEREALENLVEEVIREGGIDNESPSSDEEEAGGPKNKSPGGTNHAVGDGMDGFLKPKTNKKYYPGQLKVNMQCILFQFLFQ